MERLTRADPEAMKEERQRERGGGGEPQSGCRCYCKVQGGGRAGTGSVARGSVQDPVGRQAEAGQVGLQLSSSSSFTQEGVELLPKHGVWTGYDPGFHHPVEGLQFGPYAWL